MLPLPSASRSSVLRRIPGPVRKGGREYRVEGPDSPCRLVGLRAWWLCDPPERSLHKAMLVIRFLRDLIRCSPAGLNDPADNREAARRPRQKPFPWKLTLGLALASAGWTVSLSSSDRHGQPGETPRPLSTPNAPRSGEAAAGVASASRKTWRDAQPHLSGRKGCWCAATLTSLQGQAGVRGWLDLPALVQTACSRNQNQC